MRSFKDLREKTLTPAEKKKREEIAKAMERENPGMDMKKKMAIATWQAKKVAEGYRVHAVSKDGEKMKSGLHPTKKAASDMHYKMAKSGLYKKIEVVKEKVQTSEATVNELSKKTLGSYVKKAASDIGYSAEIGNTNKELKRHKGIAKAVDKITKEEVELEEAKRKGAPKMQGDFLKKERERNRAHDAAMGRTPTGRKKPVRTMTSTQRSLAKLRNEETQLDEISKKTLGSYVKKASADVANRSADNARDYATGNRPVGANKKAMKNMKRTQYVNKAVDKLTREDVMSADKKPEKYIKPDGKVGIRMVRVDKKVVDKDA